MKKKQGDSFFNIYAPYYTRRKDDSFWRGLVEIDENSTKPEKETVELFAKYHQIEGGFDFLQYNAEIEDNKDLHREYLFVNNGASVFRSAFSTCVGACGFEWRDSVKFDSCWHLNWIWIHPFFRNKGVLAESWERFKEIHSPFYVSQPMSRAMEGFLQKNNGGNILVKSCPCSSAG